MDNGKKMKAIVYCTIIACLKLHHTGAFDIGQTVYRAGVSDKASSFMISAYSTLGTGSIPV